MTEEIGYKIIRRDKNNSQGAHSWKLNAFWWISASRMR